MSKVIEVEAVTDILEKMAEDEEKHAIKATGKGFTDGSDRYLHSRNCLKTAKKEIERAGIIKRAVWKWDPDKCAYVCSNCGCEPIHIPAIIFSREVLEQYKFCRGCGCEMSIESFK